MSCLHRRCPAISHGYSGWPRFGSVAVWGWNGSSASGFRFQQLLWGGILYFSAVEQRGTVPVSVFLKKGFRRFLFCVRFLEDGSDGSGFRFWFGSWATPSTCVDLVPQQPKPGYSKPVVWGTRAFHPELPWFSSCPWFPRFRNRALNSLSAAVWVVVVVFVVFMVSVVFLKGGPPMQINHRFRNTRSISFRTRSTTTTERNLQFRGAVSTGICEISPVDFFSFFLHVY